jgi:hypothetical protein
MECQVEENDLTARSIHLITIKPLIMATRHRTINKNFLLYRVSILLFILAGIIPSCHKTDVPSPVTVSPAPASYSSDIISKWLTLEVRFYKNATGFINAAYTRPLGYSGIAAMEALGQDDLSWQGKYNGLGALDKPDKTKLYFWPASVNAALAEFNRNFFTSSNLTPTDLAAIDSLENAISSGFTGADAGAVSRSSVYGKSIATSIFSWSTTDGYTENNAMTYKPIVGPGSWQLTPPAFAPAIGPFWNKDRTIIDGSGSGSIPPPPLNYSEDPGSPFYKMANELYAASKVLTPDQKAMALFWRDVPGVTTPGHWASILNQIIRQTKSPLDKAARIYALMGICMIDANISVMETKYTYNLLRPITYIRQVIKDTAWLSFIPTPAHPEYLSAHSVVSAAAAESFAVVYSNAFSFTDTTYNYLGFAPRSYNSFESIAVEAGNSRFYGGIHFQPSIDLGVEEGKKVAANIFSKLGISVKK